MYYNLKSCWEGGREERREGVWSKTLYRRGGRGRSGSGLAPGGGERPGAVGRKRKRREFV